MRLRSVALCLSMGLPLTGCGGWVAPSFTSNVPVSVAPANPDMGRIVGETYVVAPGDTLAIIAERTNTPIRALIDVNGLEPPYMLAPGQGLRLKQRQDYIVQSGDTVSGLARRFHVPQSAIVDLNRLKPPYALKAGQRLVMPSPVEGSQRMVEAASGTAPAVTGGAITASALPTIGGGKPQPGAKPFDAVPDSESATAAPAPAPIATPTIPTPPSEPDLTEAEEAAESAPIPAETAEVSATPEKPATPSKSGFIWPVDGKVVSRFGTTADGLRNDGINIAAPAGAPVRASADGVVAYAGNQLRGFGNLVLIRHANGLITAYAHNQSLLVQKGDKVSRGQVIARVGSSGNVSKPQLHFEVRKNEEPVDPMKYLRSPA